MSRQTIYAKVMQQALKAGWFMEDDTTVIWVDKDVLQQKIHQLKTSFPATTLHAVAIKSNPLVGVLSEIVAMDMGLEAASIGEMALAEAAGCPNPNIVFDSPAKTAAEIRQVIENYPGCTLNADNLFELERIPFDAPIKVGLRINMGYNVAGVDYLNVSERYSKFGAPIQDKSAIIEAILAHPCVSGLHIHSGSQMDQLEQSVANIANLVDLADEINQTQPGKIKWIDIGGGLPVDYRHPMNDALPSYVAQLKELCPSLFDGTYQLITELGRWVHAQAGWTATQVEYVKPTEEGGVAVMHAGADLFVRECYSPNTWYHGIEVLAQDGTRKTQTDKRRYTLAGPLCFGGDIVDRDRLLPALTVGDWVIIEDTGANSFALWSRHCSRAFPKVLTYEKAGDLHDIQIIRERESMEELVKFWGGDQPAGPVGST